MVTTGSVDDRFYGMARKHISDFRAKWQAKNLARPRLEIGPEHDAVWPEAETLDIKPGCTHQGDITQRTELKTGYYGTVIAMEVLEHCIDPFAAMDEIDRIMLVGGTLIVSSPFNFRIHGPVPDCWRFTQNGWRLLLRNFHIVEFDVLDTPGRPLMPLHFNIAARKGKFTAMRDVKFEPINK